MGVACLLLLALTGCGEPADDGVDPADSTSVLDAMGLHRLDTDAPLDPVVGADAPQDGWTVRPVSFVVLPGFRASAALFLPAGKGPFPGVLVLPGHFGEGKTAGESQDIAHALAARGVAAFAVDTPGLEEWDQPGRQVHFEAGAHNRAVLGAAGTSALGLQVQVARRGLAAFRQVAPLDRVGVTGASGGAVLGFYLLLAEPDLVGGVLVSFVPIPREARAGGCACDTLPGWPGPDARVRRALRQPTLWLSEVEQPRPPGLPSNAVFHVLPGPHSYDLRMRTEAASWFDRLFAHTPPDRVRASGALEHPPHLPGSVLASDASGGISIFDLARQVGTPRPWTPHPNAEAPYELRCRGAGPVVITYGASLADETALLGQHLQPCALTVTEDEAGLAQAIATGGAYVDRFAGAVATAVASRKAVGAWGVGAWGVAVASSGVPFVLRDPVRALDQVDPARDPVWVHVPGGWWGGLDALYGPALSVDSDPDALARVLARVATPAIPQ